MDVANREKITRILTAATAAPSGDNSQPWHFVAHEHSIEFHYLPERDNPILNYEESGTLIALGAAIQNAELEARTQGYAPHITYCEEGSCVATMELKPGGHLDEPSGALHGAIYNRHTNRKAYAKMPLPQEIRSAVSDFSVSKESSIRFKLIESAESIKRLSRALTTMEETALANQNLHKLFFSDILWSEEDNRAGKQGLHIKTLELPPPAQAMFRLLRYWRFAKLLSKIGFPKMIAEINAKQNASASAFGIISASRLNRFTYLEIGKLLEQIWLFATTQGLSLQIVTGIAFLKRSLNVPEVRQLFTLAEQERITAAYAMIKESVDENYEPILIFRIGTSSGPTEISYRRAPEITFSS